MEESRGREGHVTSGDCLVWLSYLDVYLVHDLNRDRTSFMGVIRWKLYFSGNFYFDIRSGKFEIRQTDREHSLYGCS